MHPKTKALVGNLCFQVLLRGLVKKSRKTQKEIGESVGLTDAQVSRVLHGDRDLSFKEGCLFMQAVGMSVEDFWKKLSALEADESFVQELVKTHESFVAAKKGMKTLGLALPRPRRPRKVSSHPA